MPQTAGITQAVIEANFVKMEKDLDETKKEHRESMGDIRKALKESIEDTRKALKESHEETERALKKSIEDTRKALKESHEETERVLKESIEYTRRLSEKFDKTRRTLNEMIGGLGNTIGAVSESALVPNLVEKFNKMGYTFKDATRRAKIVSEEHDMRTEVDALLEGKTQAMAVEVKTTLKRGDVDYHVERMEKIRRIVDFLDDKRQYYGAMAAAAVDEDTMRYALDHGLFVIEPSGEDVAIVKPATVKAW